MNSFIIELCTSGEVYACTIDGQSVKTDDDIMEALADCCSSGDVEQPCEYVRDQHKPEFRIVALDASGKYENRLATHEEKAAVCREIYFESDTDFETDERWCDLYIIWQAASYVQNEGE